MRFFYHLVFFICYFSVLCGQNSKGEVKDVLISEMTVVDSLSLKEKKIYVIDTVYITSEEMIRFIPPKFISKVTFFIPRANLLFDIPEDSTVIQSNLAYLLFTMDKEPLTFALKKHDRSKDHVYPFSAFIVNKNEMAEAGSSPVIIIKRP